jgi:hypothetical protein
MADNVNIIVQDTINDIVVNAAVVVETIDINVQAAVDEVQIIANPNNYVVNINRIIGEQVQSDWTQTDNQAPDYIKNKPSIPAAQVNSDWDATTGVAQILNKPTLATVATSGSYTDLINKPTIPAAVTKTSDLINDGENGVDPFITAADVPAAVTSVGLTMPSAFSVANSPITSAGTLEVTGAGLVSQYVRGDGSLANFPTSTGGGASLSFYLNGSVSQGTFGGIAFREMDRTPILGAGTDFTISSNGYIQSFITDAGVPNLLEIPAGNWNFETYFSASSGGGSPSFYIELYKWDGTTLSLIASNSANPEGITNGTAIDLYVSALAVPQTTLLATDRLAVRIYVTTSGRTIKLHTEDNHLCQVITTFSTGITALNGLTSQVQSFATGTSGTDFAISSTTATHTFNLPTASAANRGALSSTDWSTFNGKQEALVSGTNIKTINGNSVLGSGDLVISGSNIYNANGTLTSARTLTNGGFPLTFTGNSNALSGISRGLNLTHNLVAAATNDVLVGLDIAPTFTNGAFTEVNNFGLRIEQGTRLGNNTSNIVFKRTDVSTFATIGFQGGGWNIFGIWGQNTITATNAPDIGVFATSGVAYIKNNLLIGITTNAGFKLDVNGTARVQGKITQTPHTNINGTISAVGALNITLNGTISAGNGSFTVFGTSNASSNYVIGYLSSSATFNNTVIIGESITSTGGQSVSIGNGSKSGISSVSIGYRAISTTNEFVSGANGNDISNVYFGSGVTRNNTNGVGSAYTINGSGAFGTDFAGGNLTIAGGKGTGTGTSGDVIFSTATPTTTGTTLQTLTNRWFIKGSSGSLANVSTPNASAQLQVDSTTQGFLPPRMTTTQKNAIATPAAGLVVYDTTLNKLCLYTTTWETITSL